MAASAEATLSAGRWLACQKAPYLSALLHSLVPRTCEGLGTVGTSQNMIMRYDPVVVSGWTPPQMAGVWAHECLHIQLRFFDRVSGKEPERYNEAQDIAINPMLVQMGFALPDKPAPCLPENYGFPAGLTSEGYYDLLMKQAKQGAGSPQDGSGEQDEQEGPPGAQKPGKGQPRPGKGPCSGHCGGCAGNPQPGEPQDGDADGRTPAEVERTLRAVAEAIREHAQRQSGAGTMPGELLRWADTICRPPKVRWQDKLARNIRGAIAYRPGAVEHAFHKPSRRQAGIGYGPGKPTMASVRCPIPAIGVVIDVSGSMGEEEGERAISECQGILKAVGADVQIGACDAGTHGLRKCRTVKEAIGQMVGGGGTLFTPAITALATARPSVQLGILITDGGWGDSPHIPASLRVLIVLVGKHRCKPSFTGAADIIEIDEDE